jgi:hypothetical protein
MNAARSGNGIMTMERLLRAIGTPCRLPVPGKIMFPGIGTQPDRQQLINVIASRMLCSFAFGPRFVREIYARSGRFVSELWRAVAGRAANFAIAFRLSFCRFCRHTVRTPANARIAKHAPTRSGLADARSAFLARQCQFQAGL